MMQTHAILFAMLVFCCAAAPATQPATSFMRYVDLPDGAGRLEVADAAYRNKDGAVVHLIGAVHIADKEYYGGLSESFQHYDALLYEMIKPKNMPTPKQGRKSGGHWIGNMQMFLKDRLDLTFQLEEINYRKPNFVHADMDAETFVEMQDERGESFFAMALRAALKDMSRTAKGQASSSQVNGIELLAAMMSPDQSSNLKRVLAKQFANSDDLMEGMDGPKGSVILSERNKAAFKVLDAQLAGGKKYLGLFYGAGHLKGMEKMLQDRGFKRVGVTWRTAWEIPPLPATQPTTKPVAIKP